MIRGGTPLAGALLAVSLAGCGGGIHPAAQSSPVPLTTSASSSASASASPSLDPNSDAAILAAVQAYAAAFTAVGRTGSLDASLAAIDPDCPCAADLHSLADQLNAKSEHLDAVITATNPRILRRSATNADVAVTIANGPYHVLSSSGQIVQQAAAASSTSTLSFERRGSGWIVFYVRSGSV